MSQERLKILSMLSEGKITPEEADRLLEALGETATASPEGDRAPKWLRIRVVEDGKEKVKVNIPLTLARMAVALLPKSAMVQINAKGIDLDRLLDQDLLEAGRLVDIHEDGHAVEVYVE